MLRKLFTVAGCVAALSFLLLSPAAKADTVEIAPELALPSVTDYDGAVQLTSVGDEDHLLQAKDAVQLDGKSDCGKCFGNCRCQSRGGLVAGFEAAVLKPHVGSLGFSGLGHPAAMITPTFDYAFSPRVWLGYEGPEGLGFRATYWQIDTDAQMAMPHGADIAAFIDQQFQIPVDNLGLGLGLQATTVDLEVTQAACCGLVDLQFSGGMRYGKMQSDLFVTGEAFNTPFIGGVAAGFEGVGPTVGLDFTREVGCRGLRLVGGFQASWLYGTTDAFLTGDAAAIDLVISAEDHLMQVYEAKIGVEWARQLGNGADLSLGLLWEAQAWEWAPVAGLIHQDIGLTGPTFTIAYTR